MKKSNLILITLFFVLSNLPLGKASGEIVPEASGIVVNKDGLFLVGDDTESAYFKAALPVIDDAKSINSVVISATKKPFNSGKLKLDLEAIEFLADGRKALLSEELNSLLIVGANDAIQSVIQYDSKFREFGNVGLEGLAVKDLGDKYSQIAALWEGGYTKKEDLQYILEKDDPYVMCPIIMIHDLEPVTAPPSRYISAEDPVKKKVFLEIPKYHPGDGAKPRFRAPDLVWHKWKDDKGDEVEGFIVLLGSRSEDENIENKGIKFRYTYLQRFNLEGKPVGDPLDIKKVLGKDNDLSKKNWEGMDWFEEGKKLILVYDHPSGSDALILNLEKLRQPGEPDTIIPLTGDRKTKWKHEFDCSEKPKKIP